ncbi:hypothetical protein [Rhizobium tumorigenes]|uniref:hypothetical protein n=1 Tax=Rhizobium tumorigenes TaxID=2041385 RepID=UPI00241C7C2E|nr:hypothetical protein [Rhizobium tumorigenes]WFS02193.1 hypothetical protein PR016_06155 [Rhizobium tumorigenes]
MINTRDLIKTVRQSENSMREAMGVIAAMAAIISQERGPVAAAQLLRAFADATEQDEATQQ